MGGYELALTPDGNCFTEQKATFQIYNAFIAGVGLLGAPSTREVELLVLIQGQENIIQLKVRAAYSTLFAHEC